MNFLEKHEIVKYPEWMEDEILSITSRKNGDGSYVIPVSVPPIEEKTKPDRDYIHVFLGRDAYLRYLNGETVQYKDEVINARIKEASDKFGFERIFESHVAKIESLPAPIKKDNKVVEKPKKEVVKKKTHYKVPKVLKIEYQRLPWDFLDLRDIFSDYHITYTSKGWRVAIGHGMDLDVLLFNENKFEGYIEVYAQTSLKADYYHDVFRVSGYRCRYLCDEEGNVISRAFVIDPPIGSSID